MAGAVLKQITKNFHFRDKTVFLKLYIQYERPHIEFASPVWSPWLEQDIQMLEKIPVQKKAVSMMSGLVGLNYEEKCKELNLDTLQARRDKQDLQELYKMLTMTGSLDPDTMFKKVEARQGVATRSTRDENRLQAPRTRLETRRNFFTVRVVEKWYALPPELKSAANLQRFKKGLSDLLG